MPDDVFEISTDLSTLARRLFVAYGDKAPNYRLLWEGVASGRIPAFRHKRIWRVLDSDEPAVLAYFGLAEPGHLPPTPAPAPTAPRP